MKARAGTSIVMLMLVALGSCGLSGEVVSIAEAGEWVEAIDQFPDRGPSTCMTEEEWELRDETGFDVMQYFEVFDHLSMESGYTLD